MGHPKLTQYLSHDVHDMVMSMKDPVFKMHKCLYGHPMSGHTWIDKFITTLTAQGWVQSAADRAVLRKNNTILCVYVDDVAAAGPEDELQALWDTIGCFEYGEISTSRDFLGIR